MNLLLSINHSSQKAGWVSCKDQKGKMSTQKFFQLPELSFRYHDMWPFLTEQQVRIHHLQHHKSYVDNANQILQQLQEIRKKQTKANYQCLSQLLAFNVSGHILHSLFWENLEPKDHQPISDFLNKEIKKNFISQEKFKTEFLSLAQGLQGSGWAALTYSPETDSLILIQIEKHNVNLLPEHSILLVIDVWEHAYYLDYNQNRSYYLNAIWEIINWKVVSERLKKAKQKIK